MLPQNYENGFNSFCQKYAQQQTDAKWVGKYIYLRLAAIPHLHFWGMCQGTNDIKKKITFQEIHRQLLIETNVEYYCRLELRTSYTKVQEARKKYNKVNFL